MPFYTLCAVVILGALGLVAWELTEADIAPRHPREQPYE